MELRKLREDDDRASFGCGDSALDDFFHTRAAQSQFRHRVSVTYVLVDANAIVGFVTVLPATIRRDELGPPFKRLPPSALPVLLIARMGVHSDRQRGGLGGRLLGHVCELALNLAATVGCVGVLVDAKDAAHDFYDERDFVWLPGSTQPGFTRGFLPIRTIELAQQVPS